ncbi:MAG: TPM domain-containing protein [Mycobacterium sp.]|nr:TPM domain-containing protein [Mycobacterium sp.]
MSIPPYLGANSAPIKYIWPKRIAVILAGLALVGGIGFGAKTLLHKDDTASTSQETVQSASPAPGPSQAPQSSAPGSSQAPQAPTGPTAPMALNQAVTDSAGALSGEQIAEVKSAVKSLQAARDVRLWVVYVDAFDVPPGEWARKTLSLTKMGERDAILAVATKQRKYAFLVAPAVSNRSEQAISAMRINDIEPRLRDSDFAGAAVAAATGLQALG